MRGRPWDQGVHGPGRGAGHGLRDAGDRAEQRLILASCVLLLAGAILLVGSWWLKAGRQAEVASAMASATGAPATDVVPASGFPPAGRWVVVEPGATLWTLAVRYGPSEKDPRDLVEELARLNGLSPSRPLRPGQALRLPGGWAAGR